MKPTFFLLLACLAFLGGCAAPPYVAAKRVAPASPADVVHEEGRLEAKGGVSLLRQSWRPATSPRATVIVVHGLKDYSDRYVDFAAALVRKGFAVHALDLRGHGDSGGDRVWVDGFDDYLADLDLLVAHAKAKEGDGPVFLFGHSMGGAIVTLYAVTRQPKLAGLVLSGAALKDDQSAFLTGGAKTFSVLAPSLAVFALDDAKFSRDPAVVAAMKTDPLIYDGKAPARTASEVLHAIVRLRAASDRLLMPLLVMHGGADGVTPPDGSKELVEASRSKDKTLKIYPGLFHDLLHEPEKQQVIDDVVAWLEAHVPGAPEAASAAP